MSSTGGDGMPTHVSAGIKAGTAKDGLDPQGNVILAGTRTSGAAGTPDQHFDYLVAKLLTG